jgi:hypothetical protein
MVGGGKLIFAPPNKSPSSGPAGKKSPRLLIYRLRYITSYNVLRGGVLVVIKLRAWKSCPPNRNTEISFMNVTYCLILSS